MTIEEAARIMEEEKRQIDLKKANEESEKALENMNLAQPMTQKKELNEIEAKRKRIMDRTRAKYKDCIEKRAHSLPITKFKYHIDNSTKKATMTITRNNQPLNCKVHSDFRLELLGFSEWLEFHALASKKTGKHNTQLLKNIIAKFRWVKETAKKLKFLLLIRHDVVETREIVEKNLDGFGT
ncbi:hypothetical protein Tco_1043698 [Tanacetum coccineum]|uniref:Uncharacterized protein n=1 Tax=Tanacetum coccineum TaxID=301880 RepID=A0ABQ5GQD4_9ASTR